IAPLLHSSTNSAVEPWAPQVSGSFTRERRDGREEEGRDEVGRDENADNSADNSADENADKDSKDNVDRAACANLWKFIGFTCHW
ncbi:hypothetical protein NYZ21_21840, partial [Acinetobacter baumannii]|nr:hypothetical protein [Acinetobacter baumannii]